MQTRPVGNTGILASVVGIDAKYLDNRPYEAVALDGFRLGGFASHSLNDPLNLGNVPARFYLWLRTAEETMKGDMLPLRKTQG